MIRTRLAGYATILLSAFVPLVACSDGGTGPDDAEPLTEAEAAALMETFADVVFQSDTPTPQSSSPLAPSTMARDPVTVNLTFDEEQPCPRGGRTRLAGSVDGEFDSDIPEGTFTLSFTMTPDGCVATHAESGRQFTFTGAPGVEVEMELDFTSSTLSLTGTQAGTLDWETEGKSGTCSLDIAFELSGTETSVSGSVGGTVCGFSLERSVEVRQG